MKTLNDYIIEKFQVSQEIVNNKYSSNNCPDDVADIIAVLMSTVVKVPAMMAEIYTICNKFNNYNYENLCADCTDKYDNDEYRRKNFLRLRLPKQYDEDRIVKLLIPKYGNIIIYDKKTDSPEFFVFLTGTKDIDNPNLSSSYVFSDVSSADDDLYYVFISKDDKTKYKIYTKKDIVNRLNKQ